ncbi:hypothetical protein ACIPWF_22845 [Paenarthrobacter sp. NPDC089989]|uniref:hypothetical protein n=1 Tax=unclassified Paenarthrobacter TaxID=2634190 RepID=UPI00382792B4
MPELKAVYPKVTSIIPALERARTISAKYVGSGGYSLVYGSHAASKADANSDLDLLFVCPSEFGGEWDSLVNDVKQLHSDFGLVVDEEVSYENKLIASFYEVEAAIALDGFSRDRFNRPIASAVSAESEYLNSFRFKLRLILNSLTSPNIFLGGDSTQFGADSQAALDAVLELSLGSIPLGTGFCYSDLIKTLTVTEAGDTYKDYLGYRSATWLSQRLRPSFNRLVEQGRLVGRTQSDGHLLFECRS